MVRLTFEAFTHNEVLKLYSFIRFFEEAALSFASSYQRDFYYMLESLVLLVNLKKRSEMKLISLKIFFLMCEAMVKLSSRQFLG